ncbi:hypothetical protein TorRG33x02_175060 [Trema orientale]|uniref:Transmembrane protein n=1 Tax=Trema orientale TaxID=63057 RepID=A0A2P5EMA0_TREOI|nr:hypothetical protein TorRG33x02_175060 [Trema orientale]
MALKDSSMNKTKSSSSSKKNNKKGNMFMCFWPVEHDPGDSGRVDPVLTYITVGKKERDEELDRPIKKGGSRRFSSALKAVNLLEESMAKKIKKGKSDKKSRNLTSESARYSYQTSSNRKKDFDFGHRIISRSASALATSSSAALAIANNPIALCSSCSSPIVTKTMLTESKSKHDDHVLKGYDSLDCGLILLLLNLVMLVFCGTFLAILCTSTWLYLMPHLMPAKKSLSLSSSSSSSSETNSSECKRKIVREVVLGRDRGSFRCV